MLQRRRGNTPVRPIVARPGDNGHPTAVRATHHPHRSACNRSSGPFNQDIDGFRRGCVDCPHLFWRDNRDHQCVLGEGHHDGLGKCVGVGEGHQETVDTLPGCKVERVSV